MSILAVEVAWTRETVDPAPVISLLSALPARSPDGRSFARVPCAVLGLGRRFVRSAERVEIQPILDARRRLCAVGDVRLDNRDDLKRELRDDTLSSPSDIALILAGYHRWGCEVTKHLVGDFAFVVWDWGSRHLYAARDAFGIRALTYRASPGRLILATDVAQILALPDTDRTPNDQIVVDALSWSHAHYGPTYFREIRNVSPGHYLFAGEEGLREVEYFRPPETLIQRASIEDYRREFRTLFRQAVQDRLDSEGPIVAHLSGGLDSSSIVCMADRIYGETGAVRPPLITVSAVFPGQPQDEGSFIDTVAGSVSFRSERWRGDISSGREFFRPALAIPGGSIAHNGGSAGDLEIAEAHGSRVLLAGEGGEAATLEIGLFNDLIMRGKWIALVRQIAIAGSSQERAKRRRLLKTAIREEAPDWVMKIWDLKNPPTPLPPDWLHPDLHPLWIDRRRGVPAEERRWLSRLQRGAWQFLREPRQTWILDHLGTYAANAGIEARYPFLDTRLFQFLLSIPVEYRLFGPLRRWFHREALRGVLPHEIANRASKPNFNYAVVHWGVQNLGRIRDVFEASHWLSARFVDQGRARNLLARLMSKEPNVRDWDDWRTVRSILNIEVWHRAVLRYPTQPETLNMSEITVKTGQSDSDAREEGRSNPYVPPRLSSVGNVRELLATGNLTGTDDDITAQTHD